MHSSLNKVAASATLHCLIGCAIGEVSGMVISTALGWSAIPSIVLSIGLAFVFGYSLSMRSVLKNGFTFKKALAVAFAADTISIAVMELTDNVFLIIVPSALNSGLDTALFWISLTVSLLIAFATAFPVNRYLIRRGKGHAVLHEFHSHH
jgi:hypothetical protein